MLAALRPTRQPRLPSSSWPRHRPILIHRSRVPSIPIRPPRTHRSSAELGRDPSQPTHASARCVRRRPRKFDGASRRPRAAERRQAIGAIALPRAGIRPTISHAWRPLMSRVLLAGCALLVCLAWMPAQAQVLSPYDNFSAGYIDPEKWNVSPLCFSDGAYDCAREVQSGALRLRVRAYGSPDLAESQVSS